MPNGTQRQEIAQQIVTIFHSDPTVKRAFLRGSLLDECVDAYSDIDIGIDVSGHDNAAYCQTIIRTMSQNYNLHFYDWACSLMPQSYVLTFYIKGLPVFWNVDFECTATPHHGTLTCEAVDRDPVAGLLKVWALDAKYILRRVPGIDRQVRAFGQRTLRAEAINDRDCIEIMAMVLDHLRSRIQPRHTEFYAECREVYERQLLSHAR